ncbi:hypothetical protein [Spiroplasma diminutum]|uniref:Uncharacterized protein n=1 Tax=Spiroplasma diminutum CUAS-1 TaxID=1276221 RepID=S5MJP7_9MOLU|nr:hypothetical protein [Spiroplasma diminutum]AGR42175.1 hypothetical protein SDIMI_v3c04710 [Spiroplasma diminutum CUAS-1]
MYYVFFQNNEYLVIDRNMNILYRFYTFNEAYQISNYLNYQQMMSNFYNNYTNWINITDPLLQLNNNIINSSLALNNVINYIEQKVSSNLKEENLQKNLKEELKSKKCISDNLNNISVEKPAVLKEIKSVKDVNEKPNVSREVEVVKDANEKPKIAKEVEVIKSKVKFNDNNLTLSTTEINNFINNLEK